jgi:hypothetical protein
MLTASEASGTLRVSRRSGELVLATWTAGAGVATEDRVCEAYLTLDEALAECDAAPIQERVFADARAASVVASGRARAVAGSWERWSVPPTVVEGAPVAGAGVNSPEPPPWRHCHPRHCCLRVG